MKVSRRSILAVVCLVASTMAEKNEEQQATETKAKDWYSDWVRSQEDPYVMQRVRELGKKISKARGGTIDYEPKGWFKKFLIERVRGRLFTEAREARKQAATKMEEESELEILVDDAGEIGGMSTTNAITVIGAAILCCFIGACCCILWCKK